MDDLPSAQDVERLAEVLRENEELRRLIRQLKTALNQAEQQVQQSQTAASSAIEQLQHFIYAASHDLQEPLRTVRTNAQLLERQYASDDYAKECSYFIVSAVTRMTDLIQNLLAFSRIGTSTSRAAIRLNSPLQAALFKLAGPIGESAADIKVEPLPEVQGDEAELTQVFENLLNNSLKFRGKVKPQIQISVAEGSEDYIFCIRDNGSGIDPRYLKEVLLPFKRLHGRDMPGSGLGLAICHKVIVAHGGRIWLESDGLQGTTVFFTLPIT
jgi:signal transduction histidine kinase